MNNVAPMELAVVTRAQHYENKLRICQVIGRLRMIEGDEDRIWWICEFPRPVKTDLGWLHICCVEDRNLCRIGLKVGRFRYHHSHYQLLPALAASSSPEDAAA